MKIIHCLNQYMPMAMAGTEIYVHTLATLQQKAGHEAAVITPHIEHYRPGRMQSQYKYDGIDVYQFLETADPTNRQIHYGQKKPEGLDNFNSLIRKLNPDVIHFHELNRSIGFTVEHVKNAKQSGAKIFLTMHLSSYSCNTNVLIYNKELCDGIIRERRCTMCAYKNIFNISGSIIKPLSVFGILLKKAAITEKIPDGKIKTLLSVPVTISRIQTDLKTLENNVDQLISYSKWYRNILVANGVAKDKISVVAAALVTVVKPRIDKIPRKMELPIKMVFIGRIQPTKGIHLIIEAMRSFLPGQVEIDIYGMAEDTNYYRKCIDDSKGINAINWKGELKREEVVLRLTQYDIFCLASTFSEMSPLVIQEAFAAGIPVLASKVYGNMEQIHHNVNGLLFEYNSVPSLKEQIQKLVYNPGIIQDLQNNIVTPKNFDIINEAYLKIYGGDRIINE